MEGGRGEKQAKNENPQGKKLGAGGEYLIRGHAWD